MNCGIMRHKRDQNQLREERVDCFKSSPNLPVCMAMKYGMAHISALYRVFYCCGNHQFVCCFTSSRHFSKGLDFSGVPVGNVSNHQVIQDVPKENTVDPLYACPASITTVTTYG